MKKILIFTMLISLFSCNATLSEKEKQEYSTKGKEISKATFDACNVQAAPIAQQLSEKYDVVIKRASDKLRSCDNEPSERELEIINNYKNLLEQGKELQPIVELDSTNAKHFYAPIIVKANCLVCHGKVNETMTAKTDSIIKLTYPFDIATGYNEGDVRGVWSIAFNK